MRVPGAPARRDAARVDRTGVQASDSARTDLTPIPGARTVGSESSVPPKAKSTTGQRLVIVESPAKAKTIAGYLGPGYEVEASVGHIRDLPTARRGHPGQVQGASRGPARRRRRQRLRAAVRRRRGQAQQVAKLKELAQGRRRALLATDEDREGEAIAWHLLEVLKPKVPVRRMVFHEITRDAIRAAARTPASSTSDLVDAQETRRILDRLYGYEVSPVLWKKVMPGLSAGRVQSVATRLVVERERERIAFRAPAYWDLEGTFDAGAEQFERPGLVAVDGARVATGRDFDAAGELQGQGDVVAPRRAPRPRRSPTACATPTFAVRSVEDKPYRARPAAPFMTSTLQQEAAASCGCSAPATMRVAQRLYENGYITYMRTDSTTLSETALNAARAPGRASSTAPSTSPTCRAGTTARSRTRRRRTRRSVRRATRSAPRAGRRRARRRRVRALRPDLEAHRRLADGRRRGTTVTVRLGGAAAADGRDAEFSASRHGHHLPRLPRRLRGGPRRRRGRGAATTRPGAAAAARSPRATPSAPAARAPQGTRDEPAAALHRGLPGQGARGARHRPARRRTPRSSARSSTAATSPSGARRWCPSFLAFAVSGCSRSTSRELVDYDFTAGMEDGARPRSPAASAGASTWLDASTSATPADGARRACTPLVNNLGDIDAREHGDSFPIGGTSGITLRVGRYGPLRRARRDEAPQRANVPDDLAPDELTAAKAEELLARPSGDRLLGTDPATGREIVAKAGRYGPYVTEVLPEADAARRPSPGPRRCSRTCRSTPVDARGRAAGCCRCRASSAPTPRTARRSPRRTADTART